jgi:hypothetical protein
MYLFSSKTTNRNPKNTISYPDMNMKRKRQSTRMTRMDRKRQQQCSHECEVTLQRLFIERQKWQSVCDSLQNQIDILSTVGGAIVPHQVATVEEPEERKQQSMPPDHPLYGFIHEHFNQTLWDGRTPCGEARRRYMQTQEAGQQPKTLNHISFAKEMTKYFPRQGCPKRSYYVGLELIDQQPDGESSAL